MPHYIVELRYRVPLARIEQTVAEHRAHLKTGYERGLLLASGPFQPREGGVLVARARDRQELDAFIAQDPDQLQQLANYRVMEFTPVMHQPWTADWFAVP
jgi:uncharacterized protein YciI